MFICSRLPVRDLLDRNYTWIIMYHLSYIYNRLVKFKVHLFYEKSDFKPMYSLWRSITRLLIKVKQWFSPSIYIYSLRHFSLPGLMRVYGMLDMPDCRTMFLLNCLINIRFYAGFSSGQKPHWAWQNFLHNNCPSVNEICK